MVPREHKPDPFTSSKRELLLMVPKGKPFSLHSGPTRAQTGSLHILETGTSFDGPKMEALFPSNYMQRFKAQVLCDPITTHLSQTNIRLGGVVGIQLGGVVVIRFGGIAGIAGRGVLLHNLAHQQKPSLLPPSRKPFGVPFKFARMLLSTLNKETRNLK